MSQSEDIPTIESVRVYTDQALPGTQSAFAPSTESVRKNTEAGEYKLVTADWDAPQTWKIARWDGTYEQITRQEFLANKWYVEGTTHLVVEGAHLKERNEFSVAQVYSDLELNAWQPPCEVLLFPARLAPKVLQFAEQQKNHDALALQMYLAAHPRTLRCLKKFQPPVLDFSRASWTWRDGVRDDITRMLNVTRAQWKGMRDEEMEALPYIQHCRSLVEQFIDDLTPEQQAQFRIKRGKAGPRKGAVVFDSPTQIFTAYACVYNLQGQLRTNPQGQFIGVGAVLNQVVGLNHSHMPNLARANFMHFGLRPKLHDPSTSGKQRPKRDDSQEVRAEFMRNLKVIIRKFRDVESQSGCAPSIESVRTHTDHNKAGTRSATVPSIESVRTDTGTSLQLQEG